MLVLVCDMAKKKEFLVLYKVCQVKDNTHMYGSQPGQSPRTLTASQTTAIPVSAQVTILTPISMNRNL